jgi:undecaprenyl-diphosphatase
MNAKKYRNPAIVFAITLIYTLLVMFVDRQPIGPEGSVVGFASINGPVHDLFGYNRAMYLISYVLLFVGFGVVAAFGIMGLMQLFRRKNLLKVDRWLLTLGIIYIIVLILYVIFEKVPINYRPIILPGRTELAESYPSSHTFAFCSICMSVWFALKHCVSDQRRLRILRVCALVLMVVGVMSRFLSGVHWLTDIIGGILFSATMVSLYVAWNVD